MLGGIFIVVITGLLSFFIIDALKRQFPFIDASFLKRLFFVHLLLSLAYFGYVSFSPSDSRGYYLTARLAEDWFSLYGTSTTFIKFLAYPFVQYFAFSYEAAMALFSFFGFIGFLFFYIFFKENIRFKHTFLGLDLLTLLFFLPNLHFWSASLGKGSVILLGIGLFFFGLSNIQKRLVAIAVGGIIIYHVRPHIMLIILVSSAIGFVFSTQSIKVIWKIMFLAAAVFAFIFIYQDVLTLVGIDEESFLTQGLDLTHRARELSKATSGIDISSYSLPMQVFTFLYRPLFFDAPGILGLIVSVENVFYLLITLRLFGNLKGWRYIFFSGFLAKTALLSFIMVSVALAQVSGNLGLAIRQKSQVMILFLFVVISFLDQQKLLEWRKAALRKQKVIKAQPTI